MRKRLLRKDRATWGSLSAANGDPEIRPLATLSSLLSAHDWARPIGLSNSISYFGLVVA